MQPLSDFGYEFKAVTNNGTTIKQFQSPITISTPFQDSWISDKKVTENDLSIRYYDETSGTWIKITGVLDKDNNNVTFEVDHFTKFALMAVSDTTPPDEVTGLTARGANQMVILTWTNPSNSDFDHVDIYRSEILGNIGQVVYANVHGSSKIDSGLTNGVRYYYVVRAVDTNGNSTSNTAQVSAVPNDSATLPNTGYRQTVLHH